MAATSISPGDGLLARLPAVRGRLTADAPLGKSTWFRVGGPAEVLFRPADREDLAAFLAGCPEDVPVTVMGVASNLLVRDGGVPGVVIRLGRGFTDIVPDAGHSSMEPGIVDRLIQATDHFAETLAAKARA